MVPSDASSLIAILWTVNGASAEGTFTTTPLPALGEAQPYPASCAKATEPTKTETVNAISPPRKVRNMGILLIGATLQHQIRSSPQDFAADAVIGKENTAAVIMIDGSDSFIATSSY